MTFIEGEGQAFVNDNADAAVSLGEGEDTKSGDMKEEAQLSARQTSAADIRRAGRLSVYELFAAQAA